MSKTFFSSSTALSAYAGLEYELSDALRANDFAGAREIVAELSGLYAQLLDLLCDEHDYAEHGPAQDHLAAALNARGLSRHYDDSYVTYRETLQALAAEEAERLASAQDAEDALYAD